MNTKSVRRNPLVSIVIPVYNQVDYIFDTLTSVSKQDYPNLECIVVDDGSTDGSGDIVSQFGSEIRFIRQENAGQAAAINTGWRAASGEILGYVSSDDLLDSNAISAIVNEISRNDGLSVCFPKYRLIDQNGSVIKEMQIGFSGFIGMLENFTCPIGPGALFDRSLFDMFGGWDSRFRQMPDLEFWIRMGEKATFINLDMCLASFRVHQGSQTFALSDPKKADEPIMLLASFEDKRHLYSMPTIRRMAASAYILSGCLHLRSGRYTDGLCRIKFSLKNNLFHALNFKNLKRILSSITCRLRYRRCLTR
jgi:glycosyltransferase involved in cell wall biosynthesis